MSATSKIVLPRLYAIVDVDCFRSAGDVAAAAAQHTRELIAGGASLIQYRNKSGRGREMLAHAREMKRAVVAAERNGIRLIMNDRADICLAGGFDGLHVGQDDLPPVVVRPILGPDRLLGFSTHNPEQVREADSMRVDYVAVGPVFTTASKAHPDPVIGVEGVKRARLMTKKPLVAIGGVTLANCREVIDAGADSVAVIAALLPDPRQTASEFLKLLS